MSHSVKVTIIADQYISICGTTIDIYKLRSVTLDGFGQVIGYVEESQEEFNCSEDYFEEGALNMPMTMPPGSYLSRTYKCKVCGWSFNCGWSEAGMRPEVITEMRDHVHLKHRKGDC